MDGGRRRMKANGRPVKTGAHGCTFCPSLRSLHNAPCIAYAGGFHRSLLRFKIKHRGEWEWKKSKTFQTGPEIDTQQTRQVETQTQTETADIYTPAQHKTQCAHLLGHFLTELPSGYSVTANQLL